MNFSPRSLNSVTWAVPRVQARFQRLLSGKVARPTPAFLIRGGGNLSMNRSFRS
jgi:hypothetical protein